VKVWDKREFKDLDGNVELGIRNIKIALRRLRKFARTGAPDELDLDTTIKAPPITAISTCICGPERRNAVKVLVFFDIGGSMDSHIEQVEELFSAAKTEFKHMEYFYFHNCLYEACGSRTAAALPTARRPGTCCINIRTTTRWCSSATPRCRLTRSWCPAARSSMSTKKPGRAACEGGPSLFLHSVLYAALLLGLIARSFSPICRRRAIRS
jgi:hypothetical protein